MTGFIDNLVRKAVGAPLMNAPEPSTIPRFAIHPETVVSGEEKFQDNALEDSPAIIGEECQEPVEIIENTADLPRNHDKTRSPEPSLLPSTPGFAFLSSVLPAVPEPDSEAVDLKARVSERDLSGPVPPSILFKPGAQIQQEFQSPKATEEFIELSQSPDHNKSPERSPVSLTPTSGPLTQVNSTTLRLGEKPVSHHFKPKKKGYRESLEGAAEKHNKNAALGKESVVGRRPIDISPVQGAPQKFKASDNTVVTFEPHAETSHQIQIKKLMTQKDNGFSSQPPARMGQKNAEAPQNKKQVRVNIGRIEIKASQEPVPKTKPPKRGFDDYLMPRVYLDRIF